MVDDRCNDGEVVFYFELDRSWNALRTSSEPKSNSVFWVGNGVAYYRYRLPVPIRGVVRASELVKRGARFAMESESVSQIGGGGIPSPPTRKYQSMSPLI
jgi:hypothetical protein